MKKTLNEIFEILKAKINSPELLKGCRMRPQDFNRERKLPFSKLILFIMNLVKKTLQIELTGFMKLISGKQDEEETITKSAFVQSRLKLDPKAFIVLNETLIKEYYIDNTIKTFEGFRVLAVDRMDIRLPDSNSIKERYGFANNQAVEIPMASTSSVYDVLNEMTLESIIAPYNTDELVLATEHFEYSQRWNYYKGKDLMIFDRGYGAYWFFYFLLHHKRGFIIRLKRGFSKQVDTFWSSDKQSQIISIEPTYQIIKRLEEMNIPPKTIEIRLVKVHLESGEIEVLATSLLDENIFPNSLFKDFYHLRWNIETNYNTLKNKLEIGNFTGLSPISVEQDFYASIFISNIRSLIQNDVKEQLKAQTSDRLYEYSVNRNLSLGFLKDEIVRLFIQEDTGAIIENLKTLFLKNPEPIRPDRKYPRVFKPHKRVYYINRKSAL